MSLRSAFRRSVRAAAAALTAVVLVAAGVLIAPAAHAAVAGAVAVDDAVFEWSLNSESGGGAYFGGCNFLAAGAAGDTGASRLWTEADGFYRTADGNVSIVKPNAAGGVDTPTWATKCRDESSSAVTPSVGSSTDNRVRITGGVGEVDPAANTATIAWTGSFTVVFYGGLTYWTASDPVLTVDADGSGTVVATASGYGTSMEDQSQWVPIPPRKITLATLSEVEVAESGIAVTPDYLGVSVETGSAAPQVRTGSQWGAFPQDFVDFHQRTGQHAYWYSSGGAADAKKAAAPIEIAYDAAPAVAAPTIARQPAAATVAVGEEATFSVDAAGEGLALQWQRSADETTWRDIDGATDATYTLTAAAADDGAFFRVVLVNDGGRLESEAAVLTVITASAPEITTQPQDREVGRGESAQLRVVAVGEPAPTFQWQTRSGDAWIDVDGATAATITFEDVSATASYRVVVSNAGGSVTSKAATVTVRADAEVLSETATFEWAINAASQGAAFNGACSFFVAGIADGTEASYKTVDGDLVIVKRGVGGQALEVTAENRCLPVDGSDGAQRALFTGGHAVRDADGVVTVEWQGAFTVYSYGGLVPWYVKDPTLTVDTDGTASITATLGGYRSSMADPAVKEPLPPELDMTILDLTDVAIAADGTISSTPVYAGVDYHALTNAQDPASERLPTSVIRDDVKAANPHWGSWPQDLVDFHYRTGLSSYWHTSGLSADPGKPAAPVTLSLQGSDLVYTPFAQVGITTQPGNVDVVLGSDAEFEVAATGESLTYQWQISRDGYGQKWEDIEGGREARLVLDDLSEATAYPDHAVRVLVSNGVQRIASDAATLRVRGEAPVTVVSQPTDQITHAGGAASFYAYADGFPVPTYQWQASTDDGATWSDVGDARTDGSYLTLESTESGQDGTLYRAVIANGVSETVTTDAAELTVLAADVPTISVALDYPYYPYPIDPTLGEDNFLYVRGGGLPWPSTASEFAVGIVDARAWSERGDDFSAADLLSSARVETAGNVSHGAWGPAAIPIVPGTLDVDTAYVAVTVSAVAGDRSYDSAVPVVVAGQSAPTATVAVSDAEVKAGEDVTLTSTVTGAPAPALRWQRQGGDGAWEDVAGATGVVLEVHGITESARYRVIAVNALGQASSPEVAVTVVPAEPSAMPVITLHPSSVLAPLTPTTGPATAHFTVAATGSPEPTITWQKKVGAEWLDIGEGARLEYAYSAEDAGMQVRAVARNSAGSAASLTATLELGVPATVSIGADTVSVRQGEPLTVHARVAGTAATLQWQVQAAGRSGWTNLEDEQSATLTVAAADVRHGARYRLLAESPVPAGVGGPASSATSAPVEVVLTPPSGAPADVLDAELGAPGGVELVAVDGLTSSISVGDRYAGRYVGALVHSVPRNLGWHLADERGRVAVTVPDDLEPGAHRLILVDAAGALIGSLAITVTADGAVTVSPAAAFALPATGGSIPAAAVALGALLLLAGVGAHAAGRRRMRGA